LIIISLVATIRGAEVPLYLERASTYEFIKGDLRDTVFITDAVFRRGKGILQADTAIWIKGQNIILINDVEIEDSLYWLSADRVEYDIKSNSARATGDTVTIISETDSIMARGTIGYYSRDSSMFRMYDRPTVFLNYPDTAGKIQVNAERIALNTEDKIGYADGQVLIRQADTESKSGRAIMYIEDDILLLLEEPVAARKESRIKGDTLIFYGKESLLARMEVFGNAEGNFKEISDKDSSVYDLSDLMALAMEFNFKGGELDNVIASGQAYSFYKPGTTDSSEIVKNDVSGDTIKLSLEEEKLQLVEVMGGAEGEYLTGSYRTEDTVTSFTEDTVKYRSDNIQYSLNDSTISLAGRAWVENKTVSLAAHNIRYNTASELVTAFNDTTTVDTGTVYVPVILKDGAEEIYGSYLEYSMRTDRGLIRQSKSDHELDHYTGEDLFRHKRDTYYVEDGTYCSCKYDDANYHFWAKNMKMIQGDKLIARPVVFYIEKIPLLIVPYYIFPMKPGRHSGFLSFKIGNFERGDRYISNVGYYWAASEYWDVSGALDYYEDFGLTYRGSMRYNWRYHFSGSVSGSYANESRYIGYDELKTKRWRLNFRHSQTISPTFSVMANGQFLSDKSYYTDYSTDLEDRLNRNLRSQLSLSKRWGSASLSAQFVHDVALDQETRTDRLPTASFSLPSKPLFGSPPKGDDGRENRKWYHGIYANYRVSMNNYSFRSTDTTGFRSRKKYITFDHHSSLSTSFAVFNYLKLNPSFNYQETWYKIRETDQSREKGIDASEWYRRYAYSSAISVSTDLYGTINPNVLGLMGLRHVITPRITFSWAPEIRRNDEIKAYTGVGGGGGKRKSLSMSLRHLFQAKVKSGQSEKKLDLLSVSSSVSYNFEAIGKKFSNLSTSAHTSLLKNVNLSANMVHDLYKPGTENLRWWSPYLQSFSISTTFHTRGILGARKETEKDTLSPLFPTGGLGESKQKWNLSLTHHYSEYGHGAAFQKRHTASFNIDLNLTSSIEIRYSQSYDIERDLTVSRRIEVKKDLHCWEGHFYWVPDGSNRGYYFRINVISIPDIKFEKSESGVRGTFF
jgi:lipopolysaccharide assembly outer membrane protein LptD (OstA)